MLRTIAGPLLGMLVLLTAGCAGGAGSAGGLNPSGPLAQAGGAWTGYAGVGAASAPVSLTLVQTGGKVSGEIDIAGRPEYNGPVVGSVQGNALDLRMQSGMGSFPTLTVGPDQITGILQFGPMTLRRNR